MTTVLFTLTQTSGGFATATACGHGWAAMTGLIHGTIRLVQLESPMIDKKAFFSIKNAAEAQTQKSNLRTTLRIPDNLQPKFELALDALTNFANAECIAGLPAEDARRPPMTAINRAIQEHNYKLVVKCGDTTIVLQDLAPAPLARTDHEWSGDLIVRTARWDTDRLQIIGSCPDCRHVLIDMKSRNAEFLELMMKATPFLKVSGSGRRNQASLRIQHLSGKIGELRHEHLPDELRLHFSEP